MRLQLFSDLHLERYPDFVPQFADDIDVVVLAGDIGSYQAGSRLQTEDFGLGRFSPLRPGVYAGKPPAVLYVPGNHEFDARDFDATAARLRATCAELGITWLDGAVLTIGGVRFIGSTLWSDFASLAQRESNAAAHTKALHKAFRAANYYLSKNTSLRDGQPLLAEDLRAIALDCQAWLRQALAVPFDGATVVVSHFAPSLRSADPRYGLSAGTAGFCNELDDMLAQADLWLHGHLHCANDYLASGVLPAAAGGQERPWRCRVVANPLGYLSKGEQAAFRPHMVIELPA